MRIDQLLSAALLALGLVTAVFAGDEELDAMRRRLAELEAEHARSQETIEALEAEQAVSQEWIEALRAEVDRMRAESDDDWLTEKRAEEIRGLVADVLADADTRASLLQSGATSGYGPKGFFIASADGNYHLNISATIQVQFAYNHQQNSPDQPNGDLGDDNRWGFENRRTDLRFNGHIVDPSWRYHIQGIFGSSDGGFVLLDGNITKDFENGWSVTAGNFKLPYAQEQLMSFNDIALVERTLIVGAFGAGRSQGVEVQYVRDRLRLRGAFSDGLGSITGTTSSALAEDTEFALTGRVDYLVIGEGEVAPLGWSVQFKHFNDFTPWSDQLGGLQLGAAIHWQSDEYGTTPTTPPFDEQQILRWTVDAMWKFHPFHVFVAFFGNHTTSDGTDPGVDQYGLVLQSGWLFGDEKWELFGRYEWADSDSVGSDLSVGTLGISRFFARQKLKWTTDFGYGFNPVSEQFASTGKAWRVDAPGQDGQFVFRSQLQLVF